MEIAIRQIPFRAIHIFRPSLLLGERARPRLGERIGAFLLALANPLLQGRWRQYRPVAGTAVAQAMLQAAENGGEGVHLHNSEEL